MLANAFYRILIHLKFHEIQIFHTGQMFQGKEIAYTWLCQWDMPMARPNRKFKLLQHVMIGRCTKINYYLTPFNTNSKGHQSGIDLFASTQLRMVRLLLITPSPFRPPPQTSPDIPPSDGLEWLSLEATHTPNALQKINGRRPSPVGISTTYLRRLRWFNVWIPRNTFVYMTQTSVEKFGQKSNGLFVLGFR